MAEEITGAAKIKVFGVGGGGCNAVNQMIRSGIKSAEFVAVNTDRQALYTSLAERKLQIGEVATRGLGAGAKPEKGTEAALESKKDIENELKDVDMLFITAGMGGGTGTGAAPVIASIAKEHKILTVAVVTTPFKFEGKRRMMNAMEGLHKLKKNVDTLLVIPNEKLNDIMPKGTSVINAFMEADEVLRQAVQSISDLIVKPSYVNLDFADVKTVMEGKGLAHMGIGAASGQEKAVKAMRIAVSSPLLETNIEGAKNVILNFQGGTDMTLDEMTYACELVESIADPDANIIWGADMNQSMEGKVEVTIIATGFNIEEEEEEQPEGPGSIARKTAEASDIFGGRNAAAGARTSDRRPAAPGYEMPRFDAPRFDAPDFGGRNDRYSGGERPAYPERGRQTAGGYDNNVYPPSGFARPQQPPVNNDEAWRREEPEKRQMPGFMQRLRKMRSDDDNR